MKNVATSHRGKYGNILLFFILALIPVFIKSPYYLDLFIMIIVNSVLAMTFVMLLRTGLINLGLAAFWGIGSYTSTILAMKLGLSFWLCLPATVIITLLFALLIGTFLIGKGSAGFSFVMLSSVVGMVFSVAVGNISFLGGYIGISRIPSPDPVSLPFINTITFDSKVHFYYLALFLFAIIVTIISAFYTAWTGRAWSAIGLNSKLAESIGIDLFRFKLAAFAISSAMAGAIGSFYAHYQGFVMPETYGMFTNIYIQIYAILGGVGFPVLGPFVGATVMTFFPEFFRIVREFSPIFTGVLLMILIMFLPTGLLSLGERLHSLWENLGKRFLSQGMNRQSKKA